jgi:AcrR family transcriptional regulator
MTSGKPAPISRRERPAKPALTREGIVEAALEVMRAEGLGRVTMRRLAQQLDTGAASLYVYVRNTAELHALMLDELLAGLDLSPVTAEGNWRDRLVTVLWSYVRVLTEHPELAQSALVTRPSGAGYLNLVDGLLALLSVEVSAHRASWAVDLLLHFATSTAAERGTRQRAIDAGEEEDRLAETIASTSAARYPHIAALGLDLLSGPGPDRLTWGFNVLISGILQTPRPAPDTAPGSA